MTQEEIKKEIAELDKKLANPALAEIFKKTYRKKKENFEAMLEKPAAKVEPKAEPKTAETEKKPAAKAEPKKKAAPVKDKDKPKAVKKAPAKAAPAKKAVKAAPAKAAAKTTPSAKGKGVMTFQGKPVTQETIDYCDALITKWRERRAASESGQKKTVPVTTKTAKAVSNAAKTAIESIPATAFKKNPAKMVGKMERLEKAAEEFMSALQEFIGEKYNPKQAKKELKEISDLINGLKKKYAKK